MISEQNHVSMIKNSTTGVVALSVDGDIWQKELDCAFEDTVKSDDLGSREELVLYEEVKHGGGLYECSTGHVNRWI